MLKPTLVEGSTATNPDTGAKIIYRQGKWQPLGSVANALAPGAGFMGATSVPKMAPDDAKSLRGYRDAADAGQGMRADMNRFSALNKEVGTGAGYGIPLIGDAIKATRKAFDPRVSEMDAITARVAPQMRQAGSGTMSDRDLALFQQSTVGLDKPGDTNVALAKVADAGTRRLGDHASFMDEWAKRNGSLVGAQEAWSTYAEANPLYKAGKRGTELMPVEPWRKWFGLTAAPSAAPARPTGASTARPSLGSIFGR